MQANNNNNHINGYQIIRKLGEGGNAAVYLVEKNNVQYAMKVFLFDPADRDQKM